MKIVKYGNLSLYGFCKIFILECVEQSFYMGYYLGIFDPNSTDPIRVQIYLECKYRIV